MMNVDLHNLPEEVTKKVCAYLNVNYGFIVFRDEDYGDESYLQLGEGVDLTFPVPDKQAITDKMVGSLKAESSKIRAEAEVRCKDIEEKIQSLLALPSVTLESVK